MLSNMFLSFAEKQVTNYIFLARIPKYMTKDNLKPIINVCFLLSSYTAP